MKKERVFLWLPRIAYRFSYARVGAGYFLTWLCDVYRIESNSGVEFVGLDMSWKIAEIAYVESQLDSLKFMREQYKKTR